MSMGLRLVGLVVGLLLLLTGPIAAQSTVWTSPEVTTRIPLHDAWEQHEGTDVRMYAERQGRLLIGPMFGRRAGGILRVRQINLAVYQLGPVEHPDRFPLLVQALERRISESLSLILSEPQVRSGIALMAYRFLHTGDPVTQAAIVFMDREGMLLMVEVTGHRRDEELVLGEARQVAHAVER